jgi:hypothetical protein
MKQQSLCGIHLFFTGCYVIGSRLVSDWLIVCDVAKLDSALCCVRRGTFLELISSSGVHLNMGKCTDANQSYMNNKQMLSWLLLRHGKVLNVCITKAVHRDTMERYIREQGHHLSELWYHYGHEDLLLVAAEHCAKLKRVTISGYVHPAYAASLFCACRGLLVVEIWNVELATLRGLHTFSKGLKSLTVRLNDNETTAAQLHAIAEFHFLEKHLLVADHAKLCAPLRAMAMACSSLLHIDMREMSAGTVVAFAEHCPRMQHFSGTLTGTLTPSLLNTIASCCHELSTLVLDRNLAMDNWHESLDAAVLNVVTSLHSLTLLVCLNGKLHDFIHRESIFVKYADSVPVRTGASALQMFCVTR